MHAISLNHALSGDNRVATGMLGQPKIIKQYMTFAVPSAHIQAMPHLSTKICTEDAMERQKPLALTLQGIRGYFTQTPYMLAA